MLKWMFLTLKLPKINCKRTEEDRSCSQLRFSLLLFCSVSLGTKGVDLLSCCSDTTDSVSVVKVLHFTRETLT